MQKKNEYWCLCLTFRFLGPDWFYEYSLYFIHFFVLGFLMEACLIILNGVCLILIYRFATQFWEYTSQLKLKLTLDAVHNKCTEAFCQGFAKFTFIFCLLRGQNHRSVNLSRKYQMYKHFYRLFQKLGKTQNYDIHSEKHN